MYSSATRKWCPSRNRAHSFADRRRRRHPAEREEELLQNSQGLRPYQTIQTAGESEIVISKSRFLGYCLPVSSELTAQEAIASIRKRHYDARHCCYAFRLLEGGIVRSSDDGEPSGTAGAPILERIVRRRGGGCADCAVVRYFGGALLGTGGLVRAYGKSGIGSARRLKYRDYACLRRLRINGIVSGTIRSLEQMIRAKGYSCEAEFGEQVTLSLLLPEEETEAFVAAVTDRTYGSAEISAAGAYRSIACRKHRNREIQSNREIRDKGTRMKRYRILNKVLAKIVRRIAVFDLHAFVYPRPRTRKKRESTSPQTRPNCRKAAPWCLPLKLRITMRITR